MRFDTTDPSESGGARSDTITDNPEPEMQITKYTEVRTRTPGWEMKAERARSEGTREKMAKAIPRITS